MPTFADIQEEIAGMLSIPDEDLTPDQRTALDAYLTELAKLEADKADAFGQFIRLQNAQAQACREEARRLTAKAQATENRIARLKEFYTEAMRRNGLHKVSGGVYTLSVRKAASVAVTARLDDLPALYRRTQTTVEPDQALIREALKEGVDIPGCALVESYRLDIR